MRQNECNTLKNNLMYTYQYPIQKKNVQKYNVFKKWSVALLECGIEFCNCTSIHGFYHITAPGRLWMERLLWIGACVLAIWGALDVSLGQFQRYSESPTVVTLEKDFRSWQFSLPAVTCCYTNRLDSAKLPAVIQKYWGIDVYHEKYSYYTRFVNAVASSDLFHLQQFEEFKDMETTDMFKIAVDVMPSTQMKTISSEGSNLTWRPVMTEAGVCYVTNSLAMTDVSIMKPKPNETLSSPVTCKYSALRCYIMIDVSAPAIFYVHSPYDVVDLTDPPSNVYLTLTRVTDLGVMETYCGRDVKELQPKRRGCLYTDEPIDKGRQVYSTTTCRLSCRSRLAKQLCGCIPFYYFYEGGPFCSPAGMWCLSKHSHKLANNNGEKCSCSPQCIESVFREISTKDQIWDKGPFMDRGSVKFSIQAPRTRYTREIVFHFQDLVVSFGGAAGLFLGASFISFIEILYFLMTKLFTAIFTKNKKHDKIIAIKMENIQKPKSLYETYRIQKLNAVLESKNELI